LNPHSLHDREDEIWAELYREWCAFEEKKIKRKSIRDRFGLVGVRNFVERTVLASPSNQTSGLSVYQLLSPSTESCEVINAANLNAKPGYF